LDLKRVNPLWLMPGLLLGIPLLVLVLGVLTGGIVLVLALVYFFWIPAAIFGGPHFALADFAGPKDATGVMLTAAFYVFIAALLAGAFWLWQQRGDRWTGRAIGTLLVASIVTMMVPQIHDRGALTEELEERVAAEQAMLDAAIPAYPSLEGNFVIQADAGYYVVKSSGRWRIERGLLELDADTTEILNRFPQCADCARLQSWRFALHGAREKGPYLGSEKRVGFQALPSSAGPDGRVLLKDHHMVVPIAASETITVTHGGQHATGQVRRYLAPGILADYWLAIEVLLSDRRSFAADATDPFVFADALAARGMAAPRCGSPRSIADAVERSCHDELEVMLADPARQAELEKGDRRLRSFSRDTRPLEVALWKNDGRAAEMLLEHGADPNYTDMAGYTLLMLAANRGAADVAASLARHGARLNDQYRNPGNDAGKTALIIAAANGDIATVKVLLAAGADRSIRSSTGHNAFQHAERFRHPETAALLK
jgi:hypothetical protein